MPFGYIELPTDLLEQLRAGQTSGQQIELELDGQPMTATVIGPTYDPAELFKILDDTRRAK